MDERGSLKKKILFIDDEAINLLGVRSIFRREYSVFTADSADEGIRILGATPMDAVISDQRMPGMKGTELFSRVPDRSRTGARIILTGYSSDEEVQNALSSGLIDAVMEKPLHAPSLIHCLERYRD